MIARETQVHTAFLSSADAPALFAAHGVRAAEKCQVVWDEVSLEDAEAWCHLGDLDGLIAALNAAAGGGGAPGVAGGEPAAVDRGRVTG